MRRLLIKDLLSDLGNLNSAESVRTPRYHVWMRSNLVSIADVFFEEEKVQDSYFIRGMNSIFKTNRFELLLKRWTVDYLWHLFDAFEYYLSTPSMLNKELVLEDSPLNRFGADVYYKKFLNLPKIRWRLGPNLLQKLLSIILRCPVIVYISLSNGVKIFGKRKKYKVMREAVWGLYNTGGYYFHDDFMVDGDKIKNEDVLLYSRANHADFHRLKGYHDAKKSPYAHFNLLSLSIGLGPLFLRVISKYIISSSRVLLSSISSRNFSLFWSVHSCFMYNALPYEKVFSHFELISEMGHNYYSASHIAEAIVCQNHKTKYYLMHWSDFTLPLIKHSLSFLGCDRFFSWGRAHIKGIKSDPKIFNPIGYMFKRFIKEVSFNRNNVLAEMGIMPDGKIITFFDESFGGDSEMTEEHYIIFWDTILKVAEQERNSTIVIKPKGSENYKLLSQKFREEYLVTLDKISKMKNIYFIDEKRWSFIEAVGVSDVVVTQGMTTSGTVAIICGIEGLYLDQFGYEHEFSRLFKDKIVFDNPEKLLDMIHRIVRGEEVPSKDIPEGLLREFDEYSDDRGIDLLRDILSGFKERRTI